MEQKNFILAIVLSVGFLFLWSVLVVPRFAPPAAPEVASATAPAPASPSASPDRTDFSRASRGPTSLADVSLKADHHEVILSPRGGAVRHWRFQSKGQEVDLVLYPEVSPLPLESFPDSIFRIRLMERQAVMTATLKNGIQLTKTLTLSRGGYLHQVSFRFKNLTNEPVSLNKWEWGWGAGLGTVESEMKENSAQVRALAMVRSKVIQIKEDEHPEFGRWAALDNRYFLAAFIPESVHDAEVLVSGKKDLSRVRILENTTVPPKGETTLVYDLYVGPKGYTQLKTYGLGLENTVDFGVFSSLGKFLLRVIYYLQRVTGNYGWAIILTTLGLNILLLPLSLKSFRATMAMKLLQPKIAQLQKQFKSDPKRLNVEMLNLYKHSGTNPFGGCLPMLLQIPIFLAFFNTLRNAYELKGAPFIFWIRDLSTPDKLPFMPQIHLLPIIMGGGMFLQQRMSGAITDPTQRQMMMIMPVMFTFMLYTSPSGLVIYWLTNSLVMMLFQYLFMKTHKPQEGTPQSPIIEKA